MSQQHLPFDDLVLDAASTPPLPPAHTSAAAAAAATTEPPELSWRVFVDAVRSSGLTERDLLSISEATLSNLAAHAGFAASPAALGGILAYARSARASEEAYLDAAAAALRAPQHQPRARSRSTSRQGSVAPPPPPPAPHQQHQHPGYSPLRSPSSADATAAVAASANLRHTVRSARSRSPFRSPSPSQASTAWSSAELVGGGGGASITSPLGGGGSGVGSGAGPCGEFLVREVQRRPCFSARRPLANGRAARGVSPEGGDAHTRSGRRVAAPGLPSYSPGVSSPKLPVSRTRSLSPMSGGGRDTFNRTMTNFAARTVVDELPRRLRRSLSPGLASPKTPTRGGSIGALANGGGGGGGGGFGDVTPVRSSASPARYARRGLAGGLDPKLVSSLSSASVTITSPPPRTPPTAKRMAYAQRAKVYQTSNVNFG
eukprot:Rhum_TRINITY_DN13835_c0_g1::Rhum_TRINITY_DN13835_c0_g1_i1::g.65296::m.65296